MPLLRERSRPDAHIRDVVAAVLQHVVHEARAVKREGAIGRERRAAFATLDASTVGRSESVAVVKGITQFNLPD